VNGVLGTVFIVDDARECRRALTYLLVAAGYQVRGFESAERFLEAQDCDVPGCLLLDIAMPGMSGIDLQRALVGTKRARPIIFLSGHGDIQTSVQAMKMGAVDFLTKPIDDTRLLSAVDQAIDLDVAARRERAICETIQRRLQLLTRREKRVMELVIRGLLNKQIGVELGIHEKTVKVHRMRVMKKMGVRYVANLVQLVVRAGIQAELSDVDGPSSNAAKVVTPPFDGCRRAPRPSELIAR
jgi:FixJ family two-component response regulator